MPLRSLLNPTRRARGERALLLAATVLVGLWAALDLIGDRRAIENGEGARLANQVQAIEQNLSMELQGVQAALRGVRDDLPVWPEADRPRAVTRRLTALSDAMPGVSGLQWVDAAGHVVAAGRPAAPLAEVSAQPWFVDIKAKPDAKSLYVSAPFRPAGGAQTLNVSVAVVGTQGEFAGAIAATLEPAYFDTLLGSMLYASDMWAAIVHGDGQVLVINPPSEAFLSVQLARPGTLFTQHLQSGKAATVARGLSVGSGDERLVAQRTLRPAALAMDRPLVLSISRNVHAMLQGWEHQARDEVIVLVTGAAVAWLALLMLQRRRGEVERLQAEQQARQAEDGERLRLALHGGDLALWDADITTGRGTVNERWSQMLGYEPGQVSPDDASWRALLHPDDHDRVVAAQLAHISGSADHFEAIYRLRHRDGHWVWVLDRGRVVARDAFGLALRMVGTHLDITERVQAEEALRRSEQSLAVTLQSIGDAVIATDAQGLVTRLNDTARKLTGWAGDSALGQPLSAVFRIFNARTGAPGLDPVAQVLDSGGIVALANDTVLVSRDGSRYQIADSAAPIRATEGEVLGVVLVFSDVTERYRMVQALRDREALLSSVADAMPGPVTLLDREGRYVFASAACERWFGQGLADVRGRKRSEVVGFASDETALAYERRALAGETVTYDAQITTLQGPRAAQITLVPDREGDGSVRGYFAIALDITERLRTEDALRQSEQKSRALLDALRSGVVVHASDTRILAANPAASRILGLTQEQLLGKEAIDPVWAFLEEDGTPMSRERFPVNQVLASGEPLRNLVVGFRRPDRLHTIWALCSAFPLHDTAGALQEVVVTFSEFTERKQAEEELQRAAARLRLASRLALLGSWRLDLDSGHFRMAPEGAALIDADPGEPLTFADALTRVMPAQRAGIEQAMSRRLPFEMELEVVTPRGRAMTLRVLGEPALDAAGRVVAMQGALQDVTVSRREQRRLRLLETAVSQLNDVVLITEAEPLAEPGPRIVFANAAFERLTGWRIDEVLGHSPRLLQGAQTDRAELARIKDALQQRQPVRSELLNYRRSGEAYWVDLQIVPLADAAGRVTHMVAVERDITERKQGENERRLLERQLREAQKIESIGTLAGGIAHDFNNILAAILGNAALARGDLPAGHAALRSLDQINKAGQRARALVQQILTFSRREPQVLVTQPLQPVVDETLSLLRATMPASVRLDTALAAEPLAVQADATQLQQVVMNLVTNAWHALPEGHGRIEVGVALLTDPAAAGMSDSPLPPGPCVHLWVSDNGSGMDAATRARVFDPFFTTKPVGQGTGLGLSVVHGIVRGHGGLITVDSTLGVGSSFHVVLPGAGLSATVIGVHPSGAAAGTAGAGQQVLYVDDDEVMSLMVQRLLQRAGYAVTVCTTPMQALAQLQAQPERFDLVISDFNMPEMSGTALAQQLGRLQPGLPVIITSGYIADELRQEAAAAGVRALLRKEQTLESLVGLVQQVLGSPT